LTCEVNSRPAVGAIQKVKDVRKCHVFQKIIGRNFDCPKYSENKRKVNYICNCKTSNSVVGVVFFLSY
jgi:hypothetical protein